jgi:hypothetical protein
MVPPVRRAYNQLKMNVRALPTWRNPVGDGAKRTRGLAELRSNSLIWKSLAMVRAGEKQRQAGSCGRISDLRNCTAHCLVRGALYLNPVVFTGGV